VADLDRTLKSPVAAATAKVRCGDEAEMGRKVGPNDRVENDPLRTFVIAGIL
jgi:hypothetical protein